jgi:8-oxo-dGTP pyrophosphatase MutT (NUDIX family)
MNQKRLLMKAEDPAAYAKRASEGLMLGYPVKINGRERRGDNGIGYHSTIKVFNPEKDHAHKVHELAQHLPLNPPDAKNTQIEPTTFKDRNGNDVHVLKLKGNSAEKIKEHNGKFAHMGDPQPYEYNAHISLDKPTWDRIKNAGHKTAHEAGIEFGNAELKRGPKTIKTYHHAPDSADPKFPDESDFTAKIGKSEKDICIDGNVITDEDSHALLNRQEDKYFLPKHNIEKVIAVLSERLALGDIDTDTRYNTNRTIYLDDRDLTSLHDCMTKKKPRLKVRIRQYSPNSMGWEEVAYAEFKMKEENGFSKKIRVRIPADIVESLSHGGQITMNEGLVNINKDIEKRMLEARVYAINSAIARNGLKKQIEVRYERRAYTGKNIRITIDENLRYLDATEVDPNVKTVLQDDPKWQQFLEPYVMASWENPFIMEVKSDGKLPDWIGSLLKSSEAEKAHFSKYCAAIVTHFKSGLKDSKILGTVGYLGTLGDLGKSENTLGAKPLMKPYVSEAQRRWAHTASGKEALGGNAGVHEWDEATKGKKLPERVGKSEENPFHNPNSPEPNTVSKETIPHMNPNDLRPGKMYGIGHKSGLFAKYHRSTAAAHHFSIGDKHIQVKRQNSLEKRENVDIAVVVLRDGNFVLIGRRRRNNKWGLPGGRTENGEDAKTAALRELEEETGLKLKDQDLMLAGIRKTKGGGENKRVHVFMAQYPGGVATTEEDPDEEFTKWRWVRCEDGQLPDEILDDEMTPPAEAAFKELDMTKDENSLEKGALKNAGIALGMAGALAGGAQPATAGNRAPASIQQPKQMAPSYDHGKMLRTIAQVESNNGANTNHPVASNGEMAFGKYGLMPNTIKDTIKGHKDLAAKHGKALALTGQQLQNYMHDNKGLEDQIADRHLSHMEHVLGKNPEHLGFGWLNGISGTLKARKNNQDIKNHWHVKKIRDAYNKGK